MSATYVRLDAPESEIGRENRRWPCAPAHGSASPATACSPARNKARDGPPGERLPVPAGWRYGDVPRQTSVRRDGTIKRAEQPSWRHPTGRPSPGLRPASDSGKIRCRPCKQINILHENYLETHQHILSHSQFRVASGEAPQNDDHRNDPVLSSSLLQHRTATYDLRSYKIRTGGDCARYHSCCTVLLGASFLVGNQLLLEQALKQGRGRGSDARAWTAPLPLKRSSAPSSPSPSGTPRAPCRSAHGSPSP